MAIVLEQRPEISVGDFERAEIDFSSWLGSLELLSGSPTATEVTSTDLTISAVQINSVTLSILGTDVAPYCAVIFRISGQKTGRKYTIRLTAQSDASPARVCVRDLVISVR